MQAKLSVTIFLILWCSSLDMAAYDFLYNPFGKRNATRKPQTLPWCGLLRVKLQGKMDAAAGLILIARHTAVACADDVAKINKFNIRKKARAIFFTNADTPSIFRVTDYILHPEYGLRTTNTLAIVKLENRDKLLVWQPLIWPNPSVNVPSTNLFTIGYSDEKKAFDQKIYKMAQVNKKSCMEFYHTEGLTFKLRWPSHFECYKRVGSTKTCVDDAGMALASTDGVQWTLIGMSTYGPGCILPARYIQFAPYIPWIRNTLEMKQRKSVFQSFRRQSDNNDSDDDSDDDDDVNNNIPLSDNDIHIHGLNFTNTDNLEEIPDALPSEKYEDGMKIHLDYINDKTLVISAGPLNETLGECLGKSLHVSYREEGSFDVGHGKLGRALFALSLSELPKYELSCIMAFVNCSKHSQIKLDFRHGYKQEEEEIQDMIKRIPVKSPKATTKPAPPPVKTVTDSYKKFKYEIAYSMYFRFEFIGYAEIKIEIGSLLVPTTTTPVPPTTTRTYTPHMRPGPGSNTKWRFQQVGGQQGQKEKGGEDGDKEEGEEEGEKTDEDEEEEEGEEEGGETDGGEEGDNNERRRLVWGQDP